METKTCGGCKHFRRHYIRRTRGVYVALDYGHCVYPRRKQREFDQAACPNWKPETKEEK